MVDYDKIIIAINNCSSEGEVKIVKGDDGAYFFSDEERLKFMHALVDKELDKKTDNAKAVGILLVRIKQANAQKKNDAVLNKFLRDERRNNSIAYQVLNDRDELVDKAIEHLDLASEYETPQGKDNIKKRIKEIEGELEKLNKKQSEKNRQRRTLITGKINEKVKLENAYLTLHKKKNLLTIFQAMSASDDAEAGDLEIILNEKDADGKFKTKKLNHTDFSALEVSDFAGNYLFEEKTDPNDSTKTIKNEPADETSTKIGGGSETLVNLLRSNTQSSVKLFLDSFSVSKATPNPRIYETSVSKT